MKYPDSAAFLFSIAKRARKYYLGLTTISQDVEDFLSNRLGRAVVNNSSLQLLLKQSPAAVDIVAETFKLTTEERDRLSQFPVGEGLFFAGLSHVIIRILASPTEEQLITTNPQQMLEATGGVVAAGSVGGDTAAAPTIIPPDLQTPQQQLAQAGLPPEAAAPAPAAQLPPAFAAPVANQNLQNSPQNQTPTSNNQANVGS